MELGLTSGISDYEIVSVSLKQDSEELNFSVQVIQIQDKVDNLVCRFIVKLPLAMKKKSDLGLNSHFDRTIFKLKKQ